MNSPWDKDWLEAQKKYMDALSSFGATTLQNNAGAAGSSEWQKALDYWWKSSSSVMPDDAQAIFSNLLQQSKTWYSVSDSFDELLQAVSSATDSNDNSDWESVLKEHIEKMKSQLQQGFSGVDNNFWQNTANSPLENWQKMFNSVFSDQQGMNDQFSAVHENLERLGSLAGLGPGKKIQEQVQEGLRLWQVYQNHYQTYRKTFDSIASTSLDRLQEKLIELGKQEKAVSSLRDIYDLWVDSNEEAYSDFVLTEEYSKLYGQLVNSMLAFKAHNDRFFSDTSKALNIPQSDEQDTLQQELHEIKQQQKEDKKRIRMLEEKISQLDRKDSGKPGSSTVKKKKAGKKKTSKSGTVSGSKKSG